MANTACTIKQDDGSIGCGSSDAMSTYSTHLKCWSCNKRQSLSDSDKEIGVQKDHQSIDFNDNPEEYRGILRQVLNKYGVFHNINDESTRFCYHDVETGKIKSVKVREADKTFHWSGSSAKLAEPLFGMSKFPSDGRFITITEGEFDALAAYQMGGEKSGVVSVKNGAGGALKNCQEAYEYLMSFDEIKICFDNDEHGKAAAKEVAQFLGAKAKIIKLPEGFKDANAMLEACKSRLYTTAWFNAKPYSPDDIVLASELEESLDGKPVEFAATWPFKPLNDMFGGLICPGFYAVGAGTSIGKTNFFHQTLHHFLTTTDYNIGGMFLEESIDTTIKAVVGVEMKQPIHRPGPNSGYVSADAVAALRKIAPDNRLMLVKHFAMSADEVLVKLRHMVKVGGCKIILLDHLTMLMSALGGNGKNTTQVLDKLVTDLRAFIEEHNVMLVVASHLKRIDGTPHEEGGAVGLDDFRGSHSIAQISDGVIGLERNLQGEDMKGGYAESRIMHLRGLKNRPTGSAGSAGHLLYDLDTALYNDFEYEEPAL